MATTKLENLVRVATFAGLYGMKYNGRPVGANYIRQLIKAGKIPVVEIDGMQFIDKTILK